MKLTPVIRFSGIRKSGELNLDTAVTHQGGDSCCESCGAKIDARRQARHAAFWLYQNAAEGWWDAFRVEMNRLHNAPHGEDTCNW